MAVALQQRAERFAGERQKILWEDRRGTRREVDRKRGMKRGRKGERESRERRKGRIESRGEGVGGWTTNTDERRGRAWVVGLTQQTENNTAAIVPVSLFSVCVSLHSVSANIRGGWWGGGGGGSVLGTLLHCRVSLAPFYLSRHFPSPSLPFSSRRAFCRRSVCLVLPRLCSIRRARSSPSHVCTMVPVVVVVVVHTNGTRIPIF